jgi:hypothetical protein
MVTPNTIENPVDTSGLNIFAATRIVSLIPNDGTDLTIAAAVAALPAEGGTIFIKQGVYAITAPIVIPLGKSIVFQGAGADLNALGATAQACTVLDMSAGAAGIALFTQACPGALIRSACYFRDFSVLGDNVSAQKFIELTGVDAGMRIECMDVDIYRVRDIVNTVEDTDAYFSFCKLELALLGNSSFFRNSGPGGELVWYEVDAVVGVATTDAIIAGAFPDPDWHVTDSYLGGGGGSTYAVNVIRWQTFNIDAAIVNVSGTTSRVDQIHAVDVGITFASGICSIGDSLFFNGGPGSYVLSFGGANNAVANCIFNGGVTRAIDVLAAAVDTVITGNSFVAYGTEEVRTASTGTIVTGNANARVTEIGGANLNIYDNNSGFSGSTIIGLDSVVEGSREFEATAVATPGVAFTIVFTHAGPKGIFGIGTVKNVGLETFEIEETAVDAFGVSGSVITTLLIATDYMLDAQTNIGGARPPHVSYTVAVRHLINPSVYDLRFTSQGSV